RNTVVSVGETRSVGFFGGAIVPSIATVAAWGVAITRLAPGSVSVLTAQRSIPQPVAGLKFGTIRAGAPFLRRRLTWMPSSPPAPDDTRTCGPGGGAVGGTVTVFVL